MIRRLVSRFNKWILNPATLTLAGRRHSPYAVVHHAGRRTGRKYATPVVVEHGDEGFLIPLPYGEGADWARNVCVQGGCTIEWNGRAYDVTDPEVIDSSRALSAFSVAQRLFFRLFRIRKFLSVKHIA
jgi:deazaflavin-dependent oxidoreductase (nitroreductase family)